MRRLPRSDGCQEFLLEPKPVSASNLATHLRECQGILREQTLGPTRARSNRPFEVLTPSQASLAAIFKSRNTIPKPTPTAITPSRFRSSLIQGVVRDNYPLTFGEGAGMQQVFYLLNPTVELPSHQTLRHDLDQLYDVLFSRVQHVLMVCSCPSYVDIP